MDKISICVADENEHYVELLKRYIRTSNYKDKLNITVYTDPECFKNMLEHIHEESIILASTLFIPLCSELLHRVLIQLCEVQSPGLEDQFNQIYKYRPLNQLLDQVLNRYYEFKNCGQLKSTIMDKNLRTIAVYSASGGSGVTTLSTQLAEFLTSLGKRVFYLNLESIHDGMLLASKDVTMSRFTQVLYMLKSGQPLIGKLNLLLQPTHSGHYDRFHPTRYAREWLEYDREDIQLLLQALNHTGRYDVIIMDVGSSLFNHTIGALEYSNEILWVIPDRLGAIEKTEYVMGELDRLSTQLREQVRNRSKYVLQQYSSSVVLKPNKTMEIHTWIPFIGDWQLGVGGAPPTGYRQALIRLMDMFMDRGDEQEWSS